MLNQREATARASVAGRSPRPQVKALGILSVLAGGGLLVVAVLGRTSSFGDFPSAPPRPWERFDPELARRVDGLDSLQALCRERRPADASERQRVEAAYDVVCETFTHRAARHTVFSSWPLFLAGKLHPSLAQCRDPETLAARTDSLLCGQASYLLLELVRTQGVRARHVGLNGHVVMEAWYEGDWHLYDPDLEVAPTDDSGRVLSVDELARSPELLERYYGRHPRMVEILGSREDNSFASHPPGAWFDWRGNLLARLETAAQGAALLLPAAALALGAWLTRRASRAAD